MFTTWSSWAYFTNWLGYLISFVEMIAFALYLIGFPYLMTIWSPTANFWGSQTVYVLPWMFALLDLAISETKSTASWFMFGMSVTVYLIIAIVNVIFTSRFVVHSNALYRDYLP